MTFRAGDYVQVKTEYIHETWVLACDEDGGRVTNVGWPEGQIETGLCTLEQAATDEARIKMLESIAHHCANQSRGRLASMQLAKERKWMCSGDGLTGPFPGAFAGDAAHACAVACTRLQRRLQTTRITVSVEANHGHPAQSFAFDCRVVPEVVVVQPTTDCEAQQAVER